MTPVERVIQAYGGASALARRLGISRNAVSDWRRNGRVPEDRVEQIKEVTGLSEHLIRPDLYPVPDQGAAA